LSNHARLLLYYFRMSAFFEISAKEYDWLNRNVGLGAGDKLANGPVHSVFEMLYA
jgi:hypothetical protein